MSKWAQSRKLRWVVKEPFNLHVDIEEKTKQQVEFICSRNKWTEQYFYNKAINDFTNTESNKIKEEIRTMGGIKNASKND